MSRSIGPGGNGLAAFFVALAGGVVAVLVGVGMLGCATSSPRSQSYWIVETPNFEIVSAFGPEATRDLARDLELFHAGVLKALGLDETPPRLGRTRVLAFDDRTPGRPFAVRGQASMLVPEVDHATLVFRTPGGWDERATWELKTDYAHRVVRTRAVHPLPLWLEEGLAQVAGAATVRDGKVWLGALVESHLLEVRDWRRSNLAPLVQETDLSDRPDSGRARFRAEAWSLVHALMFDASAGASARAFPASFWGAWDDRALVDPGAVAQAALDGDGGEWGDRVQRHLEGKEFALRVVQPRGWDLDKLDIEPLPQSEAVTRLAELALALERAGLAEKLYETALAEAPDALAARTGLVVARVREGAGDAQEALRAIDASGASAADLRRLGQAHLEIARRAEEAALRARSLAAARGRLRQSLALDPDSARAHLDLARVGLVAGADPADVRTRIESALALRPGALEIRLVAARLDLEHGRLAAARYRARDVASRTTWRLHRELAESLIERSEQGGGTG